MPKTRSDSELVEPERLENNRRCTCDISIGFSGILFDYDYCRGFPRKLLMVVADCFFSFHDGTCFLANFKILYLRNYL